MLKKLDQKPGNVVSGLLDYLKETGNEYLLPEVSLALQDILKKSRKPKEIIVTSATSLSINQKDNLKSSLKKLLILDLPFVNRVDKKILGGFTIRVADWFLDASLASELLKLKQKLLT